MPRILGGLSGEQTYGAVAAIIMTIALVTRAYLSDKDGSLGVPPARSTYVKTLRRVPHGFPTSTSETSPEDTHGRVSGRAVSPLLLRNFGAVSGGFLGGFFGGGFLIFRAWSGRRAAVQDERGVSGWQG